MRWKVSGMLALCALAVPAQDVISAKSGLIHWTEGVVTLEGKPVQRKAADFPAMKEGQRLRTEEGKAEVLLTPGVFLRISENSGIRLVSNGLLDTKIELLAGSALLEVGEIEKNQSIFMTLGDATLDFSRRGLFRLDFDPARVRVYDGSAVVTAGDQRITLKDGRQTPLGGVMTAEKFNKEVGDEFQRWASRRSGYIADANRSAAKRLHDSGATWGSNGWMFNPWLGLFTYLPMRGIYQNPFGYSFYSPYTIGRVYYRPAPVFYNPGPAMGGWGPGDRGMSMGSVGGRGMGSYSGGGMGGGAPAVSAAPAAPAGAGRGADGGGGGRGAGGGR